jgi:hypothetical protein
MGNSLYQASDNRSIIKGSATAKPSNAAIATSLKSTRDVTKKLAKGGCGCGR